MADLRAQQLKLLAETFGSERIDEVIERVAMLPVEVPSWGFGRGGTRFAAYDSPGVPTTVEERIAAAGRFRELTGKGRTVALHFPWDGSTPDDIARLAEWLDRAGLAAGSINANLFTPRGVLDHRLRFGSLTSPDDEIRAASVEHNLDCIEIMRTLGADTLVLWLPDGTNSPGQMSLYDQAVRLEAAVSTIYEALDDHHTLLIEYKYFEPGMYATAIPDYARSRELCRQLGTRARVLVDLGHHAPTTNVEQIVAFLLRSGDLGGFHFNDSQYADDDLATGSLHPGQLFRILCNLVEGERRGHSPIDELALMIDQSHNVKDPLAEMIESVENIETAYAKALLVDWDSLHEAQDDCDPTRADALLRDAFLTDVRPILAEARS